MLKRTVFVLSLLYPIAGHGGELPRLPDGLNCEAIRAAVAEHGKIRAVRWAREQGYTWAQIAEARRCLR